jgi:hypothetical protein
MNHWRPMTGATLAVAPPLHDDARSSNLRGWIDG